MFAHDGMGGEVNGMWTPVGLGATAWCFVAPDGKGVARHADPDAASDAGDEAAECLITSLIGAGGVRHPDFHEFLRVARGSADAVTWVALRHRTGLTAEAMPQRERVGLKPP